MEQSKKKKEHQPLKVLQRRKRKFLRPEKESCEQWEES